MRSSAAVTSTSRVRTPTASAVCDASSTIAAPTARNVVATSAPTITTTPNAIVRIAMTVDDARVRDGGAVGAGADGCWGGGVRVSVMTVLLSAWRR